MRVAAVVVALAILVIWLIIYGSRQHLGKEGHPKMEEDGFHRIILETEEDGRARLVCEKCNEYICYEKNMEPKEYHRLAESFIFEHTPSYPVSVRDVAPDLFDPEDDGWDEIMEDIRRKTT